VRRFAVLFSSTLPFLLCASAAAQEVVSAYSGMVHFLEGAVLLDDQPLEHKAATFPSIPEGSTLRTEKGRAEILLTPGVFLRLDENSAIRMVSHALNDTRLEFLHGSAIVDSLDASRAPITLTYSHSQIRFAKPGIYRIDSDTGVLQAYSGQAQAIAPDGKASLVDSAKLYFFDLGTLTNKFGEPNEDEFYDWARGRADAIAAENQLAAQSAVNPDDDASGLGVFTTPAPWYGTSPIYPAIDPGLGLGSLFIGPAFGFGAAGFMPYNVFPIFLLVRRGGDWTSRWPHRNPTSGYVAGRPGISLAPLRIPVYTPRPSPASGVRVYRPAVVAAPHPAAPATVHAIGHR
jgi:FecR protein